MPFIICYGNGVKIFLGGRGSRAGVELGGRSDLETGAVGGRWTDGRARTKSQHHHRQRQLFVPHILCSRR